MYKNFSFIKKTYFEVAGAVGELHAVALVSLSILIGLFGDFPVIIDKWK